MWVLITVQQRYLQPLYSSKRPRRLNASSHQCKHLCQRRTASNIRGTHGKQSSISFDLWGIQPSICSRIGSIPILFYSRHEFQGFDRRYSSKIVRSAQPVVSMIYMQKLSLFQTSISRREILLRTLCLHHAFARLS